MSYKAIVNEDRRLSILLFLMEETDYSLNESVIKHALSRLGHSVTRDIIISDFEFLSKIDLITSEKVGDIFVAKLTRIGLDVASSCLKVNGVKQKSPFMRL